MAIEERRDPFSYKKLHMKYFENEDFGNIN